MKVISHIIVNTIDFNIIEDLHTTLEIIVEAYHTDEHIYLLLKHEDGSHFCRHIRQIIGDIQYKESGYEDWSSWLIP